MVGIATVKRSTASQKHLKKTKLLGLLATMKVLTYATKTFSNVYVMRLSFVKISCNFYKVSFPLSPVRYTVVVLCQKIYPKDKQGTQRWHICDSVL